MSAHDGPKLSRGYMDRREWVKRCEAGKPPERATLRKVYNAAITRCSGADCPEDSGKGRTTYTFTISTASPDRYRDVVEVEGWETENYMRSPVVMWAHDYSQLPVGRTVELRQENGALVAEMEFAPAEHSPLAGQIQGLVESGFLTSCSVGFAPLEHSFDEERGGFNFKRQELLEFSIVPIPANPDATLQARAASVDVAELERWANGALELLGSESAVVPRAALEMVTKRLGWDAEDWTLPASEIESKLAEPATVAAPEPEPVSAPVETVEMAVEEPTDDEIMIVLSDEEDADDALDAAPAPAEVHEEVSVDALSPEVALEVDLEELGVMLRQSHLATAQLLADAVSKATGQPVRL